MRKIEEIKIKQVLAKLFKLRLEEVADETSMDTVASWDSLKHLKLVLALEDELGISFREEETVELISYPLIKEIIKSHQIEIV